MIFKTIGNFFNMLPETEWSKWGQKFILLMFAMSGLRLLIKGWEALTSDLSVEALKIAVEVRDRITAMKNTLQATGKISESDKTLFGPSQEGQNQSDMIAKSEAQAQKCVESLQNLPGQEHVFGIALQQRLLGPRIAAAIGYFVGALLLYYNFRKTKQFGLTPQFLPKDRPLSERSPVVVNEFQRVVLSPLMTIGWNAKLLYETAYPTVGPAQDAQRNGEGAAPNERQPRNRHQ